MQGKTDQVGATRRPHLRAAGVATTMCLLAAALVAVGTKTAFASVTLTASPPSYTFSGNPGVTRAVSITVEDSGSTSATVLSVTLGGSGSVADVPSGLAIRDNLCNGVTLAASAANQCTFDVTYTPVTGANQEADALVETTGGVLDVPIYAHVELPMFSVIKSDMNCASGGGLWRLDEPTGASTAYDYSGCGNTGSYDDALQPSASEYGPPGAYGDYGTYFNPALFDGWVETTTEADDPQTFTLGAWIYSADATYGQTIIGFGNNQDPQASSDYDRLLYVSTGGYLNLGVWDGIEQRAYTNAAISSDQWYFVAGTFYEGCTSGEGDIEVYIFNTAGQEVGSGSDSGACAQDYSGYWTIGNSKTGSHWINIGNGQMDGEVLGAFVDGAALSEAQLQAIAEAGGGDGYPVPSLVGGGSGVSFAPQAGGVEGRMTFGLTEAGRKSAPGEILLSNNGSSSLANLTTGAVVLRGSGASDFTITSDTCNNTTLSSGSSCSLKVAFRPLSPGNFSARLTIPDNTPIGSTVVDLHGSTPNGPPGVSSYRAVTLGDAAGQNPSYTAFWELDSEQGNVAYDATGNGNTGLVLPSVGEGVPITGNGAPSCLLGQRAMAFDGVADHSVKIYSGDFLGTNDGGNGYDAGSALTVEAWIYLTSWPSSGNPRVVSNGHSDDSSDNDGFELFVNSGGDSGEFAVGGGSSGGPEYATWPSQGSGGPINLEQWYFYVGTYSSSADSISVYGFTDGSTTPVLEASSTAPYTMSPGHRSVTIGGGAYGADPFPGYIADVALIPAQLTEAQIEAQYQAATDCAQGDPSQAKVTFPNVPPGSSSSSLSQGGGPQYVFLENPGSGALDVSSVSIRGVDSADFTIVNDHCNGSTVSTGSSCLMGVAFTPVSPGGLSARLVIDDTGPGGGTVVSLFGTTAQPFSQAISGQPPPPAQPGTQVGSWFLDQTSGTEVPDRSGNGNNGTYENSPTLGTPGSGSPVCSTSFTATSFDGANDQYVEVSSLENELGLDTMTVNVWFELTSALSDYGRLVSNAFTQNSPYQGFELGLAPSSASSNDSGGIFFNVGNGSTAKGTGYTVALQGNTWYDVAGVFDQNRILLYFDGSLVDQTSFQGPIASSGYPLLFAAGAGEGSTFPGAASFFTGEIAHVALYSSALSGAQIQAHYSYFTGMVAQCAYWRLDEPAGSRVAYDTSPFSFVSTYAPAEYQALSPLADNGRLNGLVTSGQPLAGTGAPICLPGDTADEFSGGYISTSRRFNDPQTLSIAAWFKTDTAGGGIISFGSLAGGQHDRALYVGTNGDLYFGVNDGATDVVSTSTPVDNGEWQFAVGTVSSSGISLMVDSSTGIQGPVSASGSGQDYEGRWWIGFFAGGWPSEGQFQFNGEIADVAVFDTALSQTQVDDLYDEATQCGIASPSEARIFFPNQPVAQQSAAQTLTITNAGTESLSFPASAVSIEGSDPEDFEVTGDTCAGSSIAAGSTCSVEVAFDPTTSGGRSAVLEVANSGAGGVLAVPLFGAVQVPYTAAVMDGGGSGTAPSAYWRLDEPEGYPVAFDSSGNANTATYEGGVTQGASIGSPFVCDPGDTGVTMNGISGRVTTGITNWSPGEQMTVEAWFEVDQWTGDNPRIVANGHSDATGNGFELYVNNGGTSGRFDVGAGGSSDYAQWSGTLNTGQWYFYVGTFDNTTDNISVYLFTGTSTTPVLSASSTTTGTVTPDAHPISIGYNPSYLGDWLDGEVAQVALYSTALSESQIEAQYTAGVSCAQPVVTPTSLFFADQPLFTTSPAQTVTLTNDAASGSPSLGVESVAIAGSADSGAGDFSLSSDSCAGADLAPGSSCTVSVEFSPQFLDRGSGARQAALVFSESLASGEPDTAQEVSLEGTVVDPQEIGVCSGGGTGAAGSSSCPPTETTGGAGAPEAYWMLDETSGRIAYDSSGNGNTGYLHGGVSLGQPGSVISDPAQTSMGFNGTNAYIDVPTLYDNVTPADLTVEGWFYPTGFTGNSRIVSNAWTDGGCGTGAASGCNVGFDLSLSAGGEAASFAVGTGTSYVQANLSLSSPLALDEWYFIAGTYSSGGTVNVYLYEEGDASVLASGSATAGTGDVAASDYDVELGRNPVYKGDYFEGRLDQVAIYYDQLSSSQLANQFEAGSNTFALQIPSALSWSVTLNGENEAVDDSSGLTAEDLTQVGYGWDIVVTSTQFTSTTGHVLPIGALVVNGSSSSEDATTPPSATEVDCPAGTCVVPDDITSYPVTIPEGSGQTYPTPATVFAAEYGSGQGEWELGTNWWVSIPANIYSATYSTTVVFTMLTGP